MSGVNKVILLGRLGKDPEIRNMENGTMVANFTMATSEVYKDKKTGERREATEWHNISCWRGIAEIAGKYLRKGEQVYIEGKLHTRSWEKDGITRYTTEIIADSLTLLGKKPETPPGPAAANAPPYPTVTSAPVGTTTDDLPF